MSCPDTRPLPLPIDVVQTGYLEEMLREGCVIATQGSWRSEELKNLVERGLAASVHCPKAMGVHQYQITAAGRQALVAAA